MELILTIFILIVAFGVLFTLVRRDRGIRLNTTPFDRELPSQTPGRQE